MFLSILGNRLFLSVYQGENDRHFLLFKMIDSSNKVVAMKSFRFHLMYSFWIYLTGRISYVIIHLRERKKKGGGI